MSEKEIIKILEKGCFYYAHDGSKNGHPGMIYWKNDDKNLYLAITTGTSEDKNSHFKKLMHATEKGVSKSFVNKRPFLGKRKDFDSEKQETMAFNIDDYEILISISKCDARESSSIRSKDRKLYKKVRKETILK